MIGYPLAATCQSMLERKLVADGLAPNYVFRTHDNGAVQAMVRAGVGYAVMPALAVDANDPGVELHEIDPPLPARRIALGVRADRTQPPVLGHFIQIAQEVCAGLGG
jgi:DNA-binding transcriptional LysR family regulator